MNPTFVPKPGVPLLPLTGVELRLSLGLSMGVAGWAALPGSKGCAVATCQQCMSHWHQTTIFLMPGSSTLSRSTRTLSRCASSAVTTLRPSGDRLKSRPPATKALAPSKACVSTEGRCHVRGAADPLPAGSGVSKTRGVPWRCWCALGDSLQQAQSLSTGARPVKTSPTTEAKPWKG